VVKDFQILEVNSFFKTEKLVIFCCVKESRVKSFLDCISKSLYVWFRSSSWCSLHHLRFFGSVLVVWNKIPRFFYFNSQANFGNLFEWGLILVIGVRDYISL